MIFFIDWQKNQSRWPHLSVCKFPDPAADPRVNVHILIGQHQIDLHFSKCDARGNSGETIARLGPLRWSCVGHPHKKSTARDLQANVSYALFCRPQAFYEISDTVKRFWEIETLGISQSKPDMVTTEEKIAFEKVSQSLFHNGERYQVLVS